MEAMNKILEVVELVKGNYSEVHKVEGWACPQCPGNWWAADLPISYIDSYTKYEHDERTRHRHRFPPEVVELEIGYVGFGFVWVCNVCGGHWSPFDYKHFTKKDVLRAADYHSSLGTVIHTHKFPDPGVVEMTRAGNAWHCKYGNGNWEFPPRTIQNVDDACMGYVAFGIEHTHKLPEVEVAPMPEKVAPKPAPEVVELRMRMSWECPKFGTVWPGKTETYIIDDTCCGHLHVKRF